MVLTAGTILFNKNRLVFFSAVFETQCFGFAVVSDVSVSSVVVVYVLSPCQLFSCVVLVWSFKTDHLFI